MESNQGSRDSQLSGPIVSLFMTPSKSPVSASNHIGPGSVVSRARRSTFREPLIKVVYLTCFTLITTGFIIECILLHLVILPSQYETGFTATECAYLRTTLVMDSVKCENRCSKDRSAFQCVRVLISYSKSGKNYTASLFDNIATYQHYHFLGVSLWEKAHLILHNESLDEFVIQISDLWIMLDLDLLSKWTRQ